LHSVARLRDNRQDEKELRPVIAVPQKITSQHGSPSDMETKPFNHITLL